MNLITVKPCTPNLRYDGILNHYSAQHYVARHNIALAKAESQERYSVPMIVDPLESPTF